MYIPQWSWQSLWSAFLNRNRKPFSQEDGFLFFVWFWLMIFTILLTIEHEVSGVKKEVKESFQPVLMDESVLLIMVSALMVEIHVRSFLIWCFEKYGH